MAERAGKKKGRGNKERRGKKGEEKSPNAGFKPPTFCSAIHVTKYRLHTKDEVAKSLGNQARGELVL